MTVKEVAAQLGPHTTLDVRRVGHFWQVRLIDLRTGRFLRVVAQFRTEGEARRFRDAALRVSKRFVVNPEELKRYRVQYMNPVTLRWITVSSYDDHHTAVYDAASRARGARFLFRVRDNVTGREIWKGKNGNIRLPSELMPPIISVRKPARNLHETSERVYLESDVKAMINRFQNALSAKRFDELKRIVGWFEGVISAAVASGAPKSYVNCLKGLVERMKLELESLIHESAPNKRLTYEVFVYDPTMGRKPWKHVGSYASLRGARMVARKKAQETGFETRVIGTSTMTVVDRYVTGRKYPYPVAHALSTANNATAEPKERTYRTGLTVRGRMKESYVTASSSEEAARKASRAWYLSGVRVYSKRRGHDLRGPYEQYALVGPGGEHASVRIYLSRSGVDGNRSQEIRNARRGRRMTYPSDSKQKMLRVVSPRLSMAVQVAGPRAAEAVASVVRARAVRGVRKLAQESLSLPNAAGGHAGLLGLMDSREAKLAERLG